VAVLKEYRGRGLGRDLLCYIMEAGFQRFPTLILDAQLSVIPFYERLGFVAEGDVFLDAGIEHRRMRIGATPDY
jgi:predicted GNAT family N-acyltransferase